MHTARIEKHLQKFSCKPPVISTRPDLATVVPKLKSIACKGFDETDVRLAGRVLTPEANEDSRSLRDFASVVAEF